MALDKEKKVQLTANIHFLVQNNKQCVVIKPEVADKINIEEVEDYLYSLGYVNFDLEKIKRAIEKANGQPQEIGPIFKKYNREKDKWFSVSVDSMEAKLTIHKIPEDREPLTEYDVIYKLREKGVKREFIDVEAIREALTKKEIGKSIVVARGKRPVNGKDAKLIYKIDLDHAGKPKELESGKVDFRELNKVIMVKKDQILVEKIPPTKGEPGYDLFGNKIEPTPGEDKPLPAGKNVIISEDQKKIIAAIDGFVYESSQGINVGEVLIVEENVDFSVGNIRYDSDVIIKKSVLAGFEVEAGRDIEIGGEVTSAKIVSNKGNIKIKGGVFGEAYIEAKEGTVEVSFVQGKAIIIGKKVIIDKYSYGGIINGIEEAKIKTVVGGKVSSQHLIEASTVGSQNNIKTVLEIYTDKFVTLNKENEDLQKKIPEYEQQLKVLNKKLQEIKDIIQKNPSFIPTQIKIKGTKLLEEYKKVKDSLDKAKKSLEENTNLIQGIKDEMKKSKLIIIEKEVWPNVEIHLLDTVQYIKEYSRGTKEISLSEEE